MPYYTQTEYEDRFGEEEAIRLTDEDNDGVANAATFTQAIAETDAEIDAMLANRYALPLSETPLVLSTIAAALLRERLHTNYPTESVTMEAQRARKLLEKIGMGKAKLPITGGELEEQKTSSHVQYSSPGRKFTQDHLDKM